MSKQKLFLIFIAGFVGIFILAFYALSDKKGLPIPNISESQTESQSDGGGLQFSDNPISIEYLRKKDYPGSDITIEQTLSPAGSYNQYIASYKSEGLKIYGLLTVPIGEKPATGFPVIIFNHGYISPSEYRTTERYESYVDYFARNDYIVFKSDYRGHGNSEGEVRGEYGNHDYTIDVLNALSSIKKYKDADPKRIGMWGHSMGGGITLRSMVISKDIKAGVIWAGVVGSYPDLLTDWNRGPQAQANHAGHRGGSWRETLVKENGTPEQNPSFWNSISANSYLKDTSGPLQLHHGTGDTHVPIVLSQKLENQMKQTGKEVELYSYEGDDHNLANNFSLAMQRSLEYFDKNVRGVSTTEE